MLKILAVIISIFLIVIIFLRIPKENMGLASLATKNSLLNIVTTVFTLIYFEIALQLNLFMN